MSSNIQGVNRGFISHRSIVVHLVRLERLERRRTGLPPASEDMNRPIERFSIAGCGKYILSQEALMMATIHTALNVLW